MESESSDSEFLVQALPAPEVDLLNPPSIETARTSPEEFMKFVRYEAATYPDVFVSANIPDMEVSSGQPIDRCSTSDAEFADFKQCCSTAEQSTIDAQLAIFDDLTTEYKWIKECCIEPRTERQCESFEDLSVLQTPPSLMWIVQLNKSEVINLLEIVASQCTKKHWTSILAIWIFALMATLERPFDPDACHLLRDIAKRFRKLARSTKCKHQADLTAKDYAFFGTYVQLVAHRFGQLDLLEMGL